MEASNISKYLSFLIFLFVIGMLVGCSDDTTSSSSQNENSEKSTNGNHEVAETYSFVASIAYPNYEKTGNPSDDIGYYNINGFFDEVEERTEGRVTFERHYNGQLIPPDQMLQALDAGTIDFAVTAPQYYTSVIPSGNLGNMLFWADSREKAHYFLTETEIGEIYDQEFEDNGAKVLVHALSDNNTIMTNFPVHSIDDFKGKILRTQGGLDTLWYKELGVTPASFTFAEVYEAMQRGVADGVITSTIGVEVSQWHEVIDYMIFPQVSVHPLNITLVGNKVWGTIPGDIQEIMLEVATEMELKQVEVGEQSNIAAKQLAEERGMDVITLSDEEFAKLRASYNVVFEEFASMSENNTRIMEIIRSELD